MNNFKGYIAELNGYLHSLRRFRGAGYFYSAQSYDAKTGIDQFATETITEWGENEEFQYLGKTEIKFEALEERLSNIIFGGALNLQSVESNESKESIRKLVLEDINEYYGLASTSLDSEGVFHPLISGPVYQLNIENKNYSNLFFYLVKIGNYYVLTSFTRRKHQI